MIREMETESLRTTVQPPEHFQVVFITVRTHNVFQIHH